MNTKLTRMCLRSTIIWPKVPMANIHADSIHGSNLWRNEKCEQLSISASSVSLFWLALGRLYCLGLKQPEATNARRGQTNMFPIRRIFPWQSNIPIRYGAILRRMVLSYLLTDLELQIYRTCMRMLICRICWQTKVSAAQKTGNVRKALHRAMKNATRCVSRLYMFRILLTILHFCLYCTCSILRRMCLLDKGSLTTGNI